MIRRLALAALLVLAGVSAARAETLVMGEAAMRALDQTGAVELRSILADGSLFLLSERTGGRNARLFRVDAAGQAHAYDVPFSRVQYAAANESGSAALLYEAPAGKLWRLDFASGRFTRVPASGFGLYGGGRSRIFPLGDGFAAWGYFRAPNGDFRGDYLVRIGSGGVQKIVARKQLVDAVTRALPGTRGLGQINLDDGFVTCVGRTARSLTGLVALRLPDAGVLRKLPLPALGGLALRGHTLCVVEGAAGGAQLVVYDLAGKSPGKALGRGSFLHPAISPDGRTVAVLSVRKASGANIGQSLMLFPIGSGAPREIKLDGGRLFLDHRFASDGSILLFDGTGVYRAR